MPNHEITGSGDKTRPPEIPASRKPFTPKPSTDNSSYKQAVKSPYEQYGSLVSGAMDTLSNRLVRDGHREELPRSPETRNPGDTKEMHGTRGNGSGDSWTVRKA